MLRVIRYPLGLLLLAAVVRAQDRSPLPELHPDILKEAVIRIMLFQANPSGQDAVWKAAGGSIHKFV